MKYNSYRQNTDSFLRSVFEVMLFSIVCSSLCNWASCLSKTCSFSFTCASICLSPPLKYNHTLRCMTGLASFPRPSYDTFPAFSVNRTQKTWRAWESISSEWHSPLGPPDRSWSPVLYIHGRQQTSLITWHWECNTEANAVNGPGRIVVCFISPSLVSLERLLKWEHSLLYGFDFFLYFKQLQEQGSRGQNNLYRGTPFIWGFGMCTTHLYGQ